MDEKEAEARPVMGTIFLVYVICMSVCLVCQINCVGGITWTKHAHAQSLFGGRLNQRHPYYLFPIR